MQKTITLYKHITKHQIGPFSTFGCVKIGEFETQWICEYPEFADSGCMEDHDPEKTRQPRKHRACGFHLVSIERV